MPALLSGSDERRMVSDAGPHPHGWWSTRRLAVGSGWDALHSRLFEWWRSRERWGTRDGWWTLTRAEWVERLGQEEGAD